MLSPYPYAANFAHLINRLIRSIIHRANFGETLLKTENKVIMVIITLLRTSQTNKAR